MWKLNPLALASNSDTWLICWQINNNQQNLSWYEVWKPRRTEDTSQWAVRRFYTLKGKYSVHGTCSHGEPNQKLQLCSSLPSQGTEPLDLGQEWLVYTRSGTSSYTHTHPVSNTPIVVVANANWESAREI